MSLKSQLSNLMPVAKACNILGEDRVSTIVSSVLMMQYNNQLQLKQQQHNAGGKQQLPTPEELAEKADEETSALVQSMLYTTNTATTKKIQGEAQAQLLEQAMAAGGLSSPSVASASSTESLSLADSAEQREQHIPPPIRQCWRKLTTSRPYLLDKMTLIKFIVPTCAQPHAGLGGHMGLFDCLVYALQTKRPSSSSSSDGGDNDTGDGNSPGIHALSPAPLVTIPDLVIFLAICQQYWDLHNDEDDPDTIVSYDSDHPAITTMAQWMFTVYDAYQKKGVVERDTLHRFLSDVYGDESYKTSPMVDQLDKIFHNPAAPLTRREFVQAVLDTMSYAPRPEHFLLDWMATLAQAMLPGMTASYDGKEGVRVGSTVDSKAGDSMDGSGKSPMNLSESTAVFLKTMEQQRRWLPQICDHYHLAESRLFEIKRRFHSLVESSTTVIQGDPMGGDTVDGCGGEDSAAAPPSSSNGRDSQNGNGRGNSSTLPKHVIPAAAFYKKACFPNDELGHGGYLPVSIAERVFESVAKMSSPQNDVELAVRHEDGVQSSDNPNSSPKAAAGKSFWDLAHVLQFGGMCVRSEDKDEALVTWIMRLFCRRNETVLDRQQVSDLLLLLCTHKDFRSTVDRPRWEDDEPSDAQADTDLDDGVDEDDKTITVMTQTALALRLLPDSFVDPASKASTSKKATVPIDTLVDHMLKVVKSKDGMLTKDQFLKWHKNTKQYERQRLGPFIMELRLIASTMFGVPPKFASLEQSLEIEIRERHKLRYPQTDVSRRGPRGTVWYLIDFKWYDSWLRVIDEVARTSEDGEDLRDKANDNAHPRRLPRISNKGLFKDNISLSLRTDVKWRHDYEIVPPLGWSALQAWYDGGPPIHRSVVPYTGSSTSSASSPHSRNRGSTMRTENEIELFPFFVTMFLCDSTSQGKARPFQQEVPLSRVNPLRVLLVQLCKGLDVDPDTGRLWFVELSDVEGDGQNDWLLDLDSNIVEQRKSRSHSETIGSTKINLLLELKDEDTGLWPRGIDGTEWTFQREDSSMEVGDGIVGLYNMGNTCYLNSSIQCLSHTPIFRDYFTTKCYLNDINRTNPLGYEGHLAQVSAVLINSLWRRFNQQSVHQPKRVTAPGSYAPVSAPALTPKTFKDSLGKFSSHFEGNEQHDAQELLAFLLAGLSEDLNQIQNKPYIENPDSDGRPDSEMADIWWANHLKREMSIIVAMFTGQYKSLLKCRTCKYESASFEPFTFLQLPLPEDDTIPVTLIYYACTEGSSVMKYCIRVHNNGTLYDVLIALANVVYSDSQKDKKVELDNNDGDSEAEKARLQAIHTNLAKNMVVVDMRDGFIFKIAPNAWRLPDLQNKETGELPLLHVYALDALPESSPSKQSDANEEEDDEDDYEDDGPAERADFLALAQRRSELVSKDLLHPLAHRVFGTPLLLRLSNLDSMTGNDVYDTVASHLKPIVHPGALKFLSDKSDPKDTKDASMGSEDDETDETRMNKEDIRHNLVKTKSNMEEVSSGHVPRYGFRLRITSRDGRRCAICPWYECCIGCYIPDDDKPTVVSNGDSIVIDWHFAVDVATSGFGTRANQADPPSGTLRGRSPGSAPVKNHYSCSAAKKKGQNSHTITLEDCLDAFSKEEKIPETYCSKCKDFRVQTKRMSLWRLPPVVIIHLKRFQFTQHMRRKLRDFVDFPVEGLDLSRIMAADSVGNPGERTSESKPDMPKQNGKAPVVSSSGDEDHDGSDDDKDGGQSVGETIATDQDSDTAEGDSKRSNLSKRVSKMNNDDGRGEMLYDLYAVVHHQGAMAGGHYVASLKSEVDGQWRLFNDAQIFEIHSRDVVDSSAYILFYIRRDVAKQNLSDFWDVRKREGEGMTEEEMDSLIKGRSERCVIS